ncbi:delta-12 fatty acid desaturas-like protein [Xylariaceae sp. FL0804]|nr:delta-12 fatty acid desaturas-like protein [Xylariaceae sp. FL0804]
MSRLRQAIPKHCFEPTIARSMSYVASDVVQYLTLLAAAIWIQDRVGFWTSLAIRYVLYPFLAGLPLTGLWVNAHECGHGGFSKSQTFNNVVGMVLHSALLTPYFAWRSSHGRHHQYANNMSADLNYVPFTLEEYEHSIARKLTADHLGEDSPILVSGRIICQQIFGWPWYLLTHITAGPKSSPRKTRGWWDNSHFLPSSSLFRASEYWNIVLSDVGLFSMISCLYILGHHFGSETVVWAYVLPWLWVNHWIVMITFLHHTSPSLPKFTEDSWTYLRGALATVDRDPGIVLQHSFHNIIDLHVIHHLFPRIPHYHAREATEAIKPLLGDRYCVDRQPYWSALWQAFTQCQWVEPDQAKTMASSLGGGAGSMAHGNDEGVLWYRAGPMPPVATTMRQSEDKDRRE